MGRSFLPPAPNIWSAAAMSIGDLSPTMCLRLWFICSMSAATGAPIWLMRSAGCRRGSCRGTGAGCRAGTAAAPGASDRGGVSTEQCAWRELLGVACHGENVWSGCPKLVGVLLASVRLPMLLLCGQAQL